MTKHLLIHGDSLALPRQGVCYEETWPYFLQDQLSEWHVLNRSLDGNTSEILNSDTDWENERRLDYFEPSAVIVQLGIADCAPRYLRKFESTLVDSVPSDILRRALLFLATNLRSRSQKRAYVPRSRYEANIDAFLGRCKAVGVPKVLFIHILSPSEKYLAKNPTVASAIKAYNEVIQKMTMKYNFVQSVRPLADSIDDELEIADEYTLEDGYHLNPEGNCRAADRILSTLQEQDPM
ncbi:SGNH/GDSL hydrolase family protein [Halorubrum sp. GN11_10-6_MGM]|uniref:SGNH/GDSL hydrolase family protein n=1 Tax=Halorubrum sp. GN11_10-6_MGM TaxID=2518112 RepID=UPI0010F84017|nr:SGNH/GDSL hydrolase family protein [Halorubrum sp. GN11_10-6_MGM]TKX72883.1 SGNH/GDSL hydrolase family protein [Halorubrum sp. GN11_10-6_MGM]